MKNWYQNSTFWGLFITLGGVVLLIQNLFNIPVGGVFWGIAFLVGGAAFLRQAFEYDRQWWPFIPGMTLLGMAGSSFVSVILPDSEFIQAALTLGGISAGFILVYLRDRTNWWAVIPGGVLFTIMILSIIEATAPLLPTEPLFLLGIGMTFLVIAWLPGHRLSWAYIPAIALMTISALVGFLTEPNSNLIWAIILILTGVVLLIRSFWKS